MYSQLNAMTVNEATTYQLRLRARYFTTKQWSQPAVRPTSVICRLDSLALTFTGSERRRLDELSRNWLQYTEYFHIFIYFILFFFFCFDGVDYVQLLDGREPMLLLWVSCASGNIFISRDKYFRCLFQSRLYLYKYIGYLRCAEFKINTRLPQLEVAT